MNVELYFSPGACSFVPHVGLEAVRAATGQDFTKHLVKLHKGEQKTPEYLQVNPYAQVPALKVDGKPLVQIVAIADWLDRTFPQVGLLPHEPWARSQALSRLAWINNTVHPTFTHVFMPQKFADDEAARAELKRFNSALYLTQLEQIQQWLHDASPYLY
ncbi:MAG: glutathione S-transferase family protein, partial [Gammaproteobacteria bacterium]